MPGWLVNVRNGQYRASRMRGDGQDLRRGKEGWFGREGQSPGPSMTVTHLTQVGVIIRLGNDRRMTLIDPDGNPNAHSFPALGSLTPAEKNRRDRAIPDRDFEFELGPDLACGVGWEPSGSFGPQCKRAPTGNAAGRNQRASVTGGSSEGE